VSYYHREIYAVQEMRTFFEVSRCGYYAWIKRMDQADRDREKKTGSGQSIKRTDEPVGIVDNYQGIQLKTKLTPFERRCQFQ
jgi:hypothetical protein